MLPISRLVRWLFLVVLFTCARGLLAQVTHPTATLTVNGLESFPSGSWDTGTIEVDFNGFVEIVSYGQYSTNASIAAALAARFSADFHSFGLYAKANAKGTSLPVVTFELVDGRTFGSLNIVDPGTSFTLTSSGFSSSSGIPDIGVARLEVNGITTSSNYGAGSTAASIAQDLAASANSIASSVKVSSDGPNIYLHASTGSENFSYPYSLTFSSNASFATSTPSTGVLSNTATSSPSVVYGYAVGGASSQSGYFANGNIESLTDAVMGTWSYSYDSLNRLSTGTPTSGPYSGTFLCWNYDNFGNRTSQSVSVTQCNSNSPSQQTFAAQFGQNNQILAVTSPSAITIVYDGAGNVTSDGNNHYTYDAEGRLCAVQGSEGLIGYQYDGNGNRIGKGTITDATSCDITQNGYMPIADFILDQSGNRMTEMAIRNGAAFWLHSNVSVDSTLLATFDTTGSGVHLQLTDAVGTRRVQTDGSGIPEQTCRSLPFGDQLYCTVSLNNPTEQHFTGKERDTESGLDYFGARYYGSNMGRFMSPDPSGLLAQRPSDPQSWNLYAYARNNPLSNIDPDGLDCVYANDAGNDVESIDHNSSSGECGGSGGSWAPGYVNENWAHFNGTTQQFQVASLNNNGSLTANYTMFAAGAETQFNSDESSCTSGCSGFASTGAQGLADQLVGNSTIGGYLSFLAGREEPVRGGGLNNLVSGPGLSPNGPNNWAGPGGMGPPTGQGDWAASVHDYNFNANGHIGLSDYFNPTLSPATARALIQSNNNLITHAGGVQSVKMGMFFGVVNAFQLLTNAWR